MDKNAIKKYAVWARTELIARVSMKAEQYGIAEDNMVDASADSVNGKVLSADEKKQRQALITQIKDKGYRQVMEEVAYTWFNRFSALRFMEVNGYLPSHVRVFTDEENRFKPQILAEAIHLELDGMDMEKVYALKDAEKTDELYRYLLIVQCNALNKILPGMFQRIADYTELLLPDNLLRQGSVIEQMISTIPESDWKDAVQIIGWLYQYYNSEKKDDVFACHQENVKITKENIPAATQLLPRTGSCAIWWRTALAVFGWKDTRIQKTSFFQLRRSRRTMLPETVTRRIPSGTTIWRKPSRNPKCRTSSLKFARNMQPSPRSRSRSSTHAAVPVTSLHICSMC